MIQHCPNASGLYIKEMQLLCGTNTATNNVQTPLPHMPTEWQSVVVRFSPHNRPSPVQLLHKHNIRHGMVQHHAGQPYGLVSSLHNCCSMPKGAANHKAQGYAVVTGLDQQASYILTACIPAALIQQNDMLSRGDGFEHLHNISRAAADILMAAMHRSDM